MLRAGATLDPIGAVLRHESPDTTAHYAKVDVTPARSMAAARMMLADDRDRYVALHRALGLEFRIQAGLLRSFVAFAEARGDRVVLAPRVLEWARQAPSPAGRRNRLLTVRRFALAMHAEDPRHEAPAANALGAARHERVRPHIWTADEIARLMNATTLLGQEGTTRPLLYRTLFGLLAATGLRISEALALRVRDVGPAHARLWRGRPPRPWHEVLP